MTTALEGLIQSPQLVRYDEQIRDLPVAEQQRRAAFYAQIDEANHTLMRQPRIGGRGA